MAARILAIGDIHGCDIALRTLLSVIVPKRDDTVVVLGDVVDRGPGSREVVEELMRLREGVNFVGILGNHEELLLGCLEAGEERESWLSVGGRATLDSYGGSIDMIPERHAAFLRSFRDYWETESEIFVHANLEPNVPLDQQVPAWLRWSRLTGEETHHPSGRRVICGHMALPTGEPAILNGLVCIDTWPSGCKWLTCLDATNDLVYQASQDGDVGGPFPLSDIGTDFTDQAEP